MRRLAAIARHIAWYVSYHSGARGAAGAPPAAPAHAPSSRATMARKRSAA
jgi:hypothetical protein